MKKEIKTSDGMITEEVFTAPSLTVSHERKVSDGNYGTTSYGCYYQVDLPVDATEEDRQAGLRAGFAAAKAAVDAAFATEQTPIEMRIAQDLGGEIVKEQPKKKYTPKQISDRKPANKETFWQELVDNPSKYFANPDKPTDRHPDFKRKGTGEALWLTDCPAELQARARQLLVRQ